MGKINVDIMGGEAVEEDPFHVDLIDFNTRPVKRKHDHNMTNYADDGAPITGISELFTNYTYSIFELNEPLGEILYEKVDDELLEEINYTPEYIRFVNELQELVFSGSTDDVAYLR